MSITKEEETWVSTLLGALIGGAKGRLEMEWMNEWIRIIYLKIYLCWWGHEQAPKEAKGCPPCTVRAACSSHLIEHPVCRMQLTWRIRIYSWKYFTETDIWPIPNHYNHFHLTYKLLEAEKIVLLNIDPLYLLHSQFSTYSFSDHKFPTFMAYCSMTETRDMGELVRGTPIGSHWLTELCWRRETNFSLWHSWTNLLN